MVSAAANERLAQMNFNAQRDNCICEQSQVVGPR